MHRRDFLKTTSTVLAGAALPSVALAAEEPVHGREILPINRGWRYHPSKVEGAEDPSFDDSTFERIVVPHTNITLPWHSFDDKDYEFISTYRRRFKTPANIKGKRVFVDFEGVMTASTVWINGVSLGEYKGGFTPFSFELTDHLKSDAENVLVVRVDSTEREDIPPFGNEIDYMTFGGIYREVALRVVPAVYIDNIHAVAKDVMSRKPSLDVDCFLAGKPSKGGALSLEIELRDGERVIAKKRKSVKVSEGTDPQAAADPETSAPAYASTETVQDPARQTVSLKNLTDVKLWDLDTPHLYTVRVRLLQGSKLIDEDTRRIGFREATFTDQGFSLNGKIVKLRGLDRHQTFPFVGQAMPGRVQRQDAKILRKGLHCNIVRTSHYPQSRHFLDCCDEIGLLVLEEIPGWQHIGPEPWKLVAIDNVGRMIRRDWNHPSIILWGVRINESKDDHDFYTRTNTLAHALDTTRQTGGIRYFQESEFLEDVFTMNDFGFPLKKPNHPKYLNTEFVGHTFPTKTTDDDERQREHTLRHARIHNQLASDPQYAGGIGWCAFDYNTHSNFGAGDRICYHGVTDIFRENKPAAMFYKSQCDPAEEIVLEPAFHWANSDESSSFTKAVVCSNCDHLKFYERDDSSEHRDWELIAELDPDRTEFEHLTWPPFILDLTKIERKNRRGWGDLRIDGFLKGKQIASKTLSGSGVDQKFVLLPDDTSLDADGADSTRVVLRVTDQFGAMRTYANDPVSFKLEGPATLIGDNPFALIGGTGAVWIRAKEQSGTVQLTATHPRLGSQTVEITLNAVPAELI
ncbi:glycoside hydrolase family 2 TIM barrel-domain containing protein [Granulicella arctica]|uniref:Beta-galactosidase n=1 Tax=Granulicella arctica TaxID=940613 RepID=A0A7Y9TGP0_9BACT|nr:glycoside hydrolase family 2 TIM barrel-domain containing protein [Granulicella arctica]NYF78970.1 beta-galactosidase [Granulicella arctica]